MHLPKRKKIAMGLHLQDIPQKVPNAILKEAKAAQQADADAQARLRAANILKQKKATAQTPEKSGKCCNGSAR